MERFESNIGSNGKTDVPRADRREGAENISAAELADAMRASAPERVETGTIDVEMLRDALERAKQNPVKI